MTSYPHMLQFPVSSLYGEELLPAGTILTSDTLKALKARCGCIGTKRVNLLEYGTIREDLEELIKYPPYHVIFNDSQFKQSLTSIMANVALTIPVLESLDYFKEKDFYTYRHMLMVFALSHRIGRELIPDYNDLLLNAVASPSHDFGKICVPLDILKKETPLSIEEKQLLAHHTLAGYVLLSCYIEDPRHFAARVARDHHERMNGTGYPAGTRLTDHMVEIVVVSDVYDALISPRPYRRDAYDNRTAIEELCQQAEDGSLNWDVVETLIGFNRKEPPHQGKIIVSKEHRGLPPKENNYGIFLTPEAHERI